jgi:uncharacterized protein YbjT (DUF2867 family)
VRIRSASLTNHCNFNETRDGFQLGVGMRVAITGGTGFVGGHLSRALLEQGHEVVIIARGKCGTSLSREVLESPAVSFVCTGIDDEAALCDAFKGCEGVAHCAGINREIGTETFESVHVQGTANVIRAAKSAGVKRIALVSFLRARPGSESAYLESKWSAEELVRASRLEWTVVKPGMIFGQGDQMVDHLSRALYTFPIFAGLGPRRVRPLAVEDLVGVLVGALVDGTLGLKTVGVVGPTELQFDDAARLVGLAIGKRRLFVRLPLSFHFAMAHIAERMMIVPLVSVAQVQMLREGIVNASNASDDLPNMLTPTTMFDESTVKASLMEVSPIRLTDLRCYEALFAKRVQRDH